MGRRAPQPAIFGTVVLSFLLPFANVSCAGGDASFAGSVGSDPGELEQGVDLKGYELVIGRDVGGELEETSDALALGDPALELGGEPFAAIALAAAVAGVVVSLVGSPRRRARDCLGCGVAGTGAIAVLGLAPVAASAGMLRVSWKAGYWICLVLLLAATWVSYEEHRRRGPPRPPPPR